MTGAIAVVLVIVAMNMTGFGIIIPMLPFYAQKFGANPQEVTFLMAVFSLFQLLSAPLWGSLSDRFGRRPVLILTLAGVAGGYLLLAVADSLAMLVATRAFAGIVAGNLGVAQAYITDVTTEKDRTQAMGSFGAALGIGFVMGPAIGGLLAGPDPLLADYASPALAAGAATLVALAFAMVLLREPERRTGAGNLRPLQALRASFLVPALGGLMVLLFGLTFVFAEMESTFALWSERVLSWGPRQNGYVFAGASLLSAAVQGGLAGRLARSMGEPRMVLAGIVFLGMGMAGIAVSTDLVLLITASVFLVLGFGFTSPALSSLIANAAPDSLRGATFGLSQSAASLARITGPTFAGTGFYHVGVAWPYLSGAVLAGAMFAGATFLFRRTLVRRA